MIRKPLVYLCLFLGFYVSSPMTGGMDKALLIQNVSIFDGMRILPDNQVLVEDGKIVDIGNRIKAPVGAHLMNGAGRTLLPGLIDSHVHVFDNDDLRQSLIFGVTTVMDMGTIIPFLAEKRKEQASGQANDRSDLYSGGMMIVAPEGHGTRQGIPVHIIDIRDEAQSIVDACIADGSDYIKIIYDHSMGPAFSKETLKAIIDAAHKRGKMAVVHISTFQDARDAIESGVDGLVHTFMDPKSDPEIGHFAARHGVFVISTLSVHESVCGIPGGKALAIDENLAPYLTARNIGILEQPLSELMPAPPHYYAYAEQGVRKIREAGVSILAGTDAASINYGTTLGGSLHRELELLVKAGLKPAEALSAATSIPAREFKLADRGRIAKGLRADLVLVNGDPTVDIKATRDIVAVWKAGIRADRESYRKPIEKQKTESSRLAKNKKSIGLESGLVSDFEEAQPTSTFGYGWEILTDKRIGGKSTAEFKIVPDGANNSRGSLSITGELIPGGQDLFAGAVFYPGKAPLSPADLSTKKEISFWAKGDGGICQIRLYSVSTGGTPKTKTFSANPDWRQFSFPISSFDGINGGDLVAVLFVAAERPGKFSFKIDGVQFK